MTPDVAGVSSRERSWWGWGWADEALDDAAVEAVGRAAASRFGEGAGELGRRDPPPVAALALRAPRIEAPAALAHLCSADPRERASHTHGKSFRDIVRNLHGDLRHPPDLVAHPRDEADVVALLDWCSEANIAFIPYGGGSSVVAGVEADVGDGYAGALSVDLTAMDRVLDIDRASRAARIQAGALGPVLEDQLRPAELTLRHFPQSFEFSTLGGWLATRSGGHFATVLTHIDDLTESLRVVTAAGVAESRRLPGSGAGPSPDRLFLGSEGTLGVITEAWMRLQDRPRWRANASVSFTSYDAGVAATREISQAGLAPANCRLLDGNEAAVAAGAPDVAALLVLGFESADHPVDAWLDRAVEIVQAHGGTAQRSSSSREGSAGTWRNSFLSAPYLRDALVRYGMIVETFETACTWDRFERLHARIMETALDACRRVCGGGSVTCRFTHVYPDGPAPYFSIYAPGRWGSQLSQWAEIKAAVSDVLIDEGATITHHHAVGRDHRPWYERQRPEPFALALRAAKGVLDPANVLNPGVLLR
jgi:alkyldihydroxyacetonephosphate synthase